MNTPERADTGVGPTVAATETATDLDELVRSHVPLVSHAVRETLARLPGHVDRDDLTSAGLAALVMAARAFDPDRGVSFASYAATRVRGALVDELRSVDWASRSVRRRARELDRVRSELTVALGRAPSDAEVAGAAGVTAEEVARNADDVQRAGVLSLQGFGDTPVDVLVTSTAPSPEAVAEKAELTGYLVDAVAELPPRLRAVVEGYFLAERPMADLAAELGVTESRVSQMRAEALVLLKEVMERAFEPDRTAGGPATGVVARRRAAYFAAVEARAAAGRRRGTGRVAS